MHWRPLLCLFAVTLAIRVAERPKSKRTTEREAIAALERELDKRVAADTFSGTVIVAKHGEPIFAQSYGLADRTKGTRNGLHVQFNLGSINKSFTATAIMRLVQDGRLSLDDTVGKLIANYPNREIADRVTIHHLLTHTGGTGDIFESDWEDVRLELRTHDDYIAKYGARPPLHAPGARWEYSNYGFVLLGAIIERVTGKSYYDAIAELVYEPATMTETASPIWNERSGAIGYTRQRGEWVPNTDWVPYRGMAAGGGDSTVHDMLAFANALVANRILDAKHTELLTRGKVKTRFGGKYAYGFGDYTIDGVRCFGHSGGGPGINGDLMICENGYTIAVLANMDPPAANRISQFVAVRLPR